MPFCLMIIYLEPYIECWQSWDFPYYKIIEPMGECEHLSGGTGKGLLASLFVIDRVSIDFAAYVYKQEKEKEEASCLLMFFFSS